MKTSIEPGQITYNSRYMQNIELDNEESSTFTGTQAPKKYLSRFITFNLKALCPGLTNETILYGLDCYVLNIDNSVDPDTHIMNKEITIFITPGALICDSALLVLSSPQILTIDYTEVEDIHRLIVVVEFKYDLSIEANRSQLFHRAVDRYHLDAVNKATVLPPYSLKLFFTNTQNQVINSNGLVWNPSTNKTFLAVFDIYKYEDGSILMDQYRTTLNQSKVINRILTEHDIEYPVNKSIINEKVFNFSENTLLSIMLDDVTYTVPRFSFIPNDMKEKVYYSFKLQLASRIAIPNIVHYTRRVERLARVSQIYHEHDN
jgi:hypothetical protein